MRPLFSAAAFLSWMLVSSPRLEAEPWVVISEIHYHPSDGGELGFVELYLPDPPRADLDGWALEGDISYLFPRGTVILPGSPIVVARDPAKLAPRLPPATSALGPFRGSLGSRSGRVALRSAAGALACEVRYQNRGRWPAAAGGTGLSLTLRDPFLDPSRPESWSASARAGGSPGSIEAFAAGREVEEGRGELLVRAGDLWSYFPGLDAPPSRWREIEFDVSSWAVGPSGLGFGDDDDATVVEDLHGLGLSLFARRVFVAGDPARYGRLLLRVDFDDGFVAYLNGREAARANMGAAGSAAAFDQPAIASREAGTGAEFDLGPASGWLRRGRNVLAIQVHNQTRDSTDLSLIPVLEAFTAPRSAAPVWGPILNEVAAGPPEKGSQAPRTVIEIFNPREEEIDLAEFFLSDDPRDLRRFPLPAGSRLAPRGFLAVPLSTASGEAVSGEAVARDGELFIALSRGDPPRVLDAWRIERPRTASPAAAGISRGRYPDGSSELTGLSPPTPGEPNRLEASRDLVISEILYHPIDPASPEYIEIHNRSGEPRGLTGFRLRGGARFDFPAGMEIPARGYLAVANDPAALARRYALPADRVAGPFTGKLADGSEALTLLDSRGLVADSVEYADREPWPRLADGGGSSLELIDPELDNSLPGTWAASAEAHKSPWRTFRYAKTVRPVGGQLIPELHFLLLEAGECLIDDVQVRQEGQLLLNESFEDASSWTAMGTHEGSGPWHEEDERCYRVLSTGRGNTHHNSVVFPSFHGLQADVEATVNFRARWRGGCAVLLVRGGGNILASEHRLEVPARAGTPGAPNSAASMDCPPVIDTPSQEPVAPAATEAVSFSARVSSRRSVSRAVLHYRRDREEEWKAVDLTSPTADGAPGDAARLWRGSVPPLPAGIVEFYLSAEDDSGRTGTFPAGAPARTALYAVGLTSNLRFPTYTLLVSSAVWREMQARPRLSNALLDATFVYQDSRIFYNVGFRPRGSPWTRRLSNNWRVTFGARTLDGRRSLILDRQGRSARPAERLVYRLVDALRAPSVRQRFVQLRVLGREDGLCEDVEEVDLDFVVRSFGARPEGAIRPRQLYKVDDLVELRGNGMRVRHRAALDYRTSDPEDYRWNYQPRVDDGGAGFAPLLRLLEALGSTDDGELRTRVEQVADVDEWLRVLAARTVAGDWDTVGRHNGKNAFLYLSPADGRFKLLPWDCDQAGLRYPPNDPVVAGEQRVIARILRQPEYQRSYLGYLGYLARTKLEPRYLDAFLGDVESGAFLSAASFREFLLERRDFVLSELPEIPFRVLEVERLAGPAGSSGLRIRGEGPVLIQRVRLEGKEVWCRPEGLEGWSADISLESAAGGSKLTLEALDFGGGEVARAEITLPEER